MAEATSRDLAWRRSSVCADGTCIEVAAAEEWVFLRDGKSPDGAVLRFTRTEWADFQRGMKQGDFDLM
jgi:hypothetical protein